MVSMWFLLFVIGAKAADPEIKMTGPEIIAYWGYPVEIYHAVTVDGYILELHRIPHGINDTSDTCRPILFLQHGLLSDSANFVLNPPASSAGMVFADAGFDVWMGNFRGNDYSKNHTTLSTWDPKFWNFTWDDMAQYDLDAMIDMSLNVTGHDSVYYVGHSQGTLAMFVKLSYDKEFAKKIKQYYALAPIGSLTHMGGFLGFLSKYFGNATSPLFSLFGNLEFLPESKLFEIYRQLSVYRDRFENFCSLQALLGTYSTAQYNASRSAVYTSHFPCGTSVRNIAHFIQLSDNDGQVRKFDYGLLDKEVYGTSIPPAYNYTAIETDMFIYWSLNDTLVTPEDAQITISRLNPAYVKGSYEVVGFSHTDFKRGLLAPSEIYKPIIETIRKDLNGAAC